MSSPLFVLQKMLINQLEADGELMARLATPRIYDSLPRRAALPYLTLGKLVTTRLTADGDEFVHLIDFLAFADDGGRAGVLAIADQVRRRLLVPFAASEGVACVNRGFERLESLRSRNGQVWQATLTMRFATSGGVSSA